MCCSADPAPSHTSWCPRLLAPRRASTLDPHEALASWRPRPSLPLSCGALGPPSLSLVAPSALPPSLFRRPRPFPSLLRRSRLLVPSALALRVLASRVGQDTEGCVSWHPGIPRPAICVRWRWKRSSAKRSSAFVSNASNRDPSAELSSSSASWHPSPAIYVLASWLTRMYLNRLGPETTDHAQPYKTRLTTRSQTRHPPARLIRLYVNPSVQCTGPVYLCTGPAYRPSVAAQCSGPV
jgi:hypothetical protein